MCDKRCTNIFYWVKKRLVWDVFRIEKIRDKDNKTGLKKGGGIEILITSIYAMHAPFRILHFDFTWRWFRQSTK